MSTRLFALVVAVSLVVVAAGAGTARAEISTFIYNVPSPELRTAGGSVYFAVKGFGTSTTPYYPVLPTKRVNYEIPFGAQDVSVTIMPSAAQSLGIFPNYLMRQPPMPLGNPDYTPPARPKQIPDVIPLEYYAYRGEREFRGHRLVEIVLYPVQYKSSTGAVDHVTSYSISVFYSLPMSLKASEEIAARGRSSAFEPLARGIIENYDEMNPSLLEGSPGLEGGPGAPAPLHDLSNPAYAVITTSTYQTMAQTLADWKTKKGVPTQVYTVTWITSTYPGYDTQEKIRNFLRLDNSTPRFDYVFLLGDTNVLPDRKCKCEYDGDLVPCDYYFSDVVDGAIGAGYDWDSDNDHIWGELSGDQITWLPDTYVGRMATRSTTEATNYVNAVISYEKNPPAGSWMKKVVFGPSFANFVTSSYGPTDMACVSELVRTNLLGGTGVTYDRIYEAAGIYPSTFTRDYDLTATNFRDRVALGCGLAFPSGHGNYLGNYRTIWAGDYNSNGYCDTGETSTFDLCTQSYNPATGAKRPFVLVGACLAGEFDRTAACLGDFIINNWGIGDVSSSRTSYYCVEWNDPDWPWNQGQEYRWWQEIFTNGKHHMGQIHGDNKYHYVQDFAAIEGGAYGPDQDDASRKNMFSSNLFGDPELPIWTEAAASLSVVHNATLPKAPSTYIVTVTSGGSPLAGATVCLWKGTEVYLVQDTNGSGIATFNPSPTTTGTMYVTVTKHNYIPYEGSATVQEVGDTTPPTVIVNAPDGGESWGIGSTHNINWTATDNVGVTSITIVLSRDGGTTFPDTLAKGEANDSVYPWLVPSPPSTTARIKVIAYDAAGNSGADASNSNFQIFDGTPPAVTLNAPNGGEGWAIDSFFDITWTATDNVGVASITLILSRDGAMTFPDTLAKGEVNDGIYHWQVPPPPTTTARIKVIAYDAAGNLNADMSNANFQMVDTTPPTVTVTAPNGGEIWDIGSTYDITWTATDNIGITAIAILLSSDGGAAFPDTLAAGEANDGIYSWLVESGSTLEARIKVIGYDAAGNSGADLSNADFELYDPASGVTGGKEIPERLVISGNAPNPFGESTTIRFGLPTKGQIEMDVFDVSGRKVARLAQGDYPEGYHKVEWHGISGRGIYFVRLRLGEEEVTRKIVISK
ncbi:MAG: C25 family cysteine peptidase [Candidatus Eisenbacteria bacterium]